MGRPCASCSNPKADELNRKLRHGTSFRDVSRWLLESGTSITPQSIASHAKAHLGVPSVRGRRVPSEDFLESVRDAAAEGVASGELAVTVKDGIAAQRGLDARAESAKDRDWQLKLVMALTGRITVARIVDPEVEAIEGQFLPLLSDGAA